MAKEKEEVLRFIHQLQGSNMNLQQFIAQELNKPSNIIPIMNIKYDILGNKGKEVFSLNPTNINLIFFLEENHILFKVLIGKVKMHDEKFSYQRLITVLNNYLDDKVNLKDRIFNSLKPLIDNYVYIFHGIYQLRHFNLVITDSVESKEITDSIVDDTLERREYLLMNNDSFKYINNLDPDELKIISINSPEYVTYIREGGGDILNSATNLNYQSIAEMLKATALINHKEFVKSLMFLDLGIYDKKELEGKYKSFIRSNNGTLINNKY